MDIESVFTMGKKTEERTKKRKVAYVYLMHRMFCGAADRMMDVLRSKDISLKELEDWDEEFREEVFQIISDENNSGDSSAENGGIPSIKSIKEKTLRRIYSLINSTDDPARLGQVYKILSEFESTDEKKEKSVVDAVNENIKPLLVKDKETPVTMLDVIRADGKSPLVPIKRGRGRPPKKKVVPEVNAQEE